MSIWDQYKLEDKIRDILISQSYYEPGHHFGRPFLSGYQIAIEFEKRYPKEFALIGKPIGGKGTNLRNSLAEYFSGQLSARIKSGQITDIGGGFFSNIHLKDIEFTNNGIPVHSSLTDSGYDLSIFRVITANAEFEEL